MDLYNDVRSAIFNFYSQADSMEELKGLEEQVAEISDLIFYGFGEWFSIEGRSKGALEIRRAK